MANAATNSAFQIALDAAPALVRVGIPLLALGVAALFLAAVRRTEGSRGEQKNLLVRSAFGTLALFVIPAVLALGGVLSDATRRPPAMMPVMVGSLVLTVVAARSSIGGHIAQGLPLWVLVATQAFRLPLELVMHRAATSSVMPVEMSFSGYNFDIVTGATALLLGVGLAIGNVPRGVVLAWNVMGSVLLAIVVGVAIAGFPWIAAFGPDRVNRWVLYFPYVWLPTVLVQAALFGHIVVFRRLWSERRSTSERYALGAGTPLTPH